MRICPKLAASNIAAAPVSVSVLAQLRGAAHRGCRMWALLLERSHAELQSLLAVWASRNSALAQAVTVFAGFGAAAYRHNSIPRAARQIRFEFGLAAGRRPSRLGPDNSAAAGRHMSLAGFLSRSLHRPVFCGAEPLQWAHHQTPEREAAYIAARYKLAGPYRRRARYSSAGVYRPVLGYKQARHYVRAGRVFPRPASFFWRQMASSTAPSRAPFQRGR